MRFTEYLEKHKDIINEPLKDFQIDYLNLEWNTPDEFVYSKLLKIILTCINKLPLYITIKRNYDWSAVSLGASSQFSDMHTQIEYDSLDFKKLESDSMYTAQFICQCLAPFGNLAAAPWLKDISVKQLAKFLDMTKIVVR